MKRFERCMGESSYHKMGDVESPIVTSTSNTVTVAYSENDDNFWTDQITSSDVTINIGSDIISAISVQRMASGSLCGNSRCTHHSSSCNLLSQQNISIGGAINASQENARPFHDKDLITISPCLVAVFIFTFGIAVLGIFFLWVGQFHNYKYKGIFSTTVQNWWSPRPYGKW